MKLAQDEIIASVSSEPGPDNTLTLVVKGRLNTKTVSAIWRDSMDILSKAQHQGVTIDASKIDYCDMSGVAFIIDIKQHLEQSGEELQVQGLQEEFQKLLNMFGQFSVGKAIREEGGRINIFEQLGRNGASIWQDMIFQLAFIGELCCALLYAIFHPKKARWSETWHISELVGVNAFFIIALIGFLIGVILAFQSAIPMGQFGVQIFVVDIVALSLLRELAPLITAVIIAGRTGSAFAAELGTMKVNEEIDALTTMGLNPVRFLVVSRVIAAVAMTPLLSIFSVFFGLLGCLMVMQGLGYTFAAFTNQLQNAVGLNDLFSGLIKTFVFGFIVTAVGCLRGLRTKTGASAVGESTTSAVVTAIVLLVVVDGIFSIIYFYIGI